jgi:hypothetical protein
MEDELAIIIPGKWKMDRFQKLKHAWRDLSIF